MTRTNKILIAIAALAGIWTYIKYPAWQLEEAHRNSGSEAACSLKKLDGQQWATCSYATGGSIWLQRGAAWIAANGGAKTRAERLSHSANRGGAILLSDPTAHIDVPPAIAARL